jgi:hypothetical protein
MDKNAPTSIRSESVRPATDRASSDAVVAHGADSFRRVSPAFSCRSRTKSPRCIRSIDAEPRSVPSDHQDGDADLPIWTAFDIATYMRASLGPGHCMTLWHFPPIGFFVCRIVPLGRSLDAESEKVRHFDIGAYGHDSVLLSIPFALCWSTEATLSNTQFTEASKLTTLCCS